jgi:hypothetical protein
LDFGLTLPTGYCLLVTDAKNDASLARFKSAVAAEGEIVFDSGKKCLVS